MKNKKHLWVRMVLLCTLLVGLFCGFAQKKPEEMVILVSESGNYGFDKVLEKYARKQPYDIRFEKLPLSGGKKSASERENEYKRVNSELMAGKGPDVILLTRVEVDTLFPDMQKTMRSGIFADINKVMENSAMPLSKINPFLLQAGQAGGKQYLLPMGYSIPGVLITDGTSAKGKALLAAQTQPLSKFLQKFDSLYPDVNFYGLPNDHNDMLPLGLLPLMDYDTYAVQFNTPLTGFLLEREREFWSKREDPYTMENRNAPYFIHNYLTTAIRLEGAPKSAGTPECLLGSAGRGGAQEAAAAMREAYPNAVFIPTPNESGTVYAELGGFVAVRSNTPYTQEAAAFIEWLYSEEMQMNASPLASLYGLYGFPVLDSSLGEFLTGQKSITKNSQTGFSPMVLQSFISAEKAVRGAHFIGSLPQELYFKMHADLVGDVPISEILESMQSLLELYVAE